MPNRHPRRAATDIAARLEETPYEEQPAVFEEELRKSCLPLLPARHWKRPKRLFSQSFEALFILGRASLPLSVGLCMHQYMTSGLLTAPAPDHVPINRNRDFLRQLVADGNLVLVSSYGDRIQGAGRKKHEVAMRTEGDQWIASGRKVFNSMASAGDWITFAADDPERGLCLFLAPLKDRPEMKLGPTIFGQAMLHTDTRILDYQDLVVEDSWVLADQNDDTYDLLHFSTSWFEALVSACYLGAASRALAEARKFSLEVVTSHGCLLGEMDGVQTDLGRLRMILEGAVLRASRFGEWVERIYDFDSDKAGARLLEESSAIKYSCSQAVEAVVNGVRALVGTRTMSPGSILLRINEQAHFAQLHPLMGAIIERDLGRQVLSQEPFLGLDDYLTQ